MFFFFLVHGKPDGTPTEFHAWNPAGVGRAYIQKERATANACGLHAGRKKQQQLHSPSWPRSSITTFLDLERHSRSQLPTILGPGPRWPSNTSTFWERFHFLKWPNGFVNSFCAVAGLINVYLIDCICSRLGSRSVSHSSLKIWSGSGSVQTLVIIIPPRRWATHLVRHNDKYLSVMCRL